MNVIDMHNHFIAPEVIDYLGREGKHYATRIVERDGRRFLHDPGIGDAPDRRNYLKCARSNRGHGSRGHHDASDIMRSIPDVPGC